MSDPIAEAILDPQSVSAGQQKLDVVALMILLTQLSSTTNNQSTQLVSMSQKLDAIMATHGKDLAELKEARAANARVSSIIGSLVLFCLGVFGWYMNSIIGKFDKIYEEVIRLEERVEMIEARPTNKEVQIK